MKTPREILLSRHEAAETRLDQIRRDVLADLRREENPVREAPLLIAAALKLWRELVLPSRVAWAGIATGWVVIGVLNLTQGKELSTATRPSAATRQELRAAWEQRRVLMLELALLPTSESAEPPKPNLRPRSARRAELICA